MEGNERMTDYITDNEGLDLEVEYRKDLNKISVTNTTFVGDSYEKFIEDYESITFWLNKKTIRQLIEALEKYEKMIK